MCPGCQQCPHSHARLAGGSSVFGAGGEIWDWTRERVGGRVEDRVRVGWEMEKVKTECCPLASPAGFRHACDILYVVRAKFPDFIM